MPARTARLPWYLWCAALAVTCANVGGQWDIAWHRSIGRDGFWSAPHVVIYLCGVLAGVACGYLIVATTFGRGDRKAAAGPDSGRDAGATGRDAGATGRDAGATGRDAGAAVAIWGFRGPLGAFIASWGGLTMLASAPFDNWWHGAYGLDVKILSPPHVVLMIGALAVQIGALILVLGEMNRAPEPERRPLEWLYLYVGGMILCSQYTGIMEYAARPSMHSAIFYRAVALNFTPVLVGVAGAARSRWATTITASIYTAFYLALLWILPLVHAEPKLGPITHPVTTLIPAGFPLLIVVPAVVMDLVRPRIAWLGRWPRAVVLGAVFVGCFLLAQWPFANFLNSPGAHNAFFGSGYLDYRTGPDSHMARNLYFDWEHSALQFDIGIGVAALAAVLMARLGLAWGDWMRRIRR